MNGIESTPGEGLARNKESALSTGEPPVKKLKNGAPCPEPRSGTYEGSATNKKRDDYLEWPEYFMAIALLSAQRSKDPATQLGACIVNEERKIVGIGYNGMPTGCHDDDLPWGVEADDPLERKHFYVCHAEMNAIMNKNSADVKRCTMYVDQFPCNECAKLVIQSGLKKVFYLSEGAQDTFALEASRRLLRNSGVQFEQFVPKRENITIDFSVV